MARQTFLIFSCLFAIAVASKLPLGLDDHLPIPLGKGIMGGHDGETTTHCQESTTMGTTDSTMTLMPGKGETTTPHGGGDGGDSSGEDDGEDGKMTTTTERHETTTAKKCRRHEVWTDCGTACPATCKNPKPEACTEQCVPGCMCRKGYKRNNKGKCVKRC